MNLSEDINRIKEVMGIKESREMTFFKRRTGFLLNSIRTSYNNYVASRFTDFDEFIKRIAFHATRDLSVELEPSNFDKQEEIINKFYPVVFEFINKNEEIYEELHNYFFSNGGFGDFKKSSFKELMSLHESEEMYRIKRRTEALLSHIIDSYDYLGSKRFENFDSFLKRVVFSATRDFVGEEIGGDYDKQLKLRDELEPKVLEFIKKHSIHDEIYDHFIANQ